MTDERMKQLMWQVGMPNSLSLYGALQQAENEGFQAGAASRDAEVVSLTNQRDYEYVRAENAEQERDQLREQVNDLRGALKESYPWERHFQEKCDCQFCQVLAATETKP